MPAALRVAPDYAAHGLFRWAFVLAPAAAELERLREGSMRLLGAILGTLAVVLAWAVAGFVVLFLAYELLVMSGVHVA